MSEKATANREIKRINRAAIFGLLRREGPLSRQDLVRRLELCLPTVTQNLLELQAEGLVREAGSVGNTGGRRAMTYGMAEDARFALGLDITRRQAAAVAVDLRGRMAGCVRVPLDFERTRAYSRRLGELVERLIAEAGLDRARILGVGIGVPGLITADNRRVFYGKILDFTGASIEEFSRDIPFPCAFCNDANAAGFAEIWNSPERENAFYLMLSNNVGGSVLIQNQVYPGENLRGGEVGHITLVPGGKPCYCGQRGCVDPYCAATVLADEAGGSLDRFFALLREGDPGARARWEEYLHDLALAVNNLRMLFDCTIILGGYVGGYLDGCIDELRALAAARNTFEDNADYLEVCRCKTESIAIGAALPYLDAFLAQV